jgi:PIN domain nuclease of toxin-antitoxin system
MLNLDLLFALQGTLTPRETRVLCRNCWGISAIVMWEIAKLYQKDRITVGLDSPLFLSALARLHIWPLSREVSLNVAALDFASDPVDELIASTSWTYNVPLVTRDERMRTSKLVKFA